MSTVAELVNTIVTEGNFDASKTTALGWLDGRHKLMCARTDCFRRTITMGPTVQGQQGYPLPPEVREIRQVLVESSPTTGGKGVPYGAGQPSDLAQGALGYLWLGGMYLGVGGGIFTRDESAVGEDLLALFPVPGESGRVITVSAVCRPMPLELVQTSVVVGNSATIRWAFTTRALTEEEAEAFDGGGALPAGVGFDPTSVRLTYAPAGGTAVTLTGGSITKEAVGVYTAVVFASVAGRWTWTGLGFNGLGAQIVATPEGEFTVLGGVAGLKTPEEFDDALISGAIATGLSRIEGRGDLAQEHESRFAVACEELKKQVNRRYRGAGPNQIRIQGINATS